MLMHERLLLKKKICKMFSVMYLYMASPSSSRSFITVRPHGINLTVLTRIHLVILERFLVAKKHPRIDFYDAHNILVYLSLTSNKDNYWNSEIQDLESNVFSAVETIRLSISSRERNAGWKVN